MLLFVVSTNHPPGTFNLEIVQSSISHLPLISSLILSSSVFISSVPFVYQYGSAYQLSSDTADIKPLGYILGCRSCYGLSALPLRLPCSLFSNAVYRSQRYTACNGYFPCV